MSSQFQRSAPFLCILVLAALPGLVGCSVLGIATSNDLETVQAEQRTQSRRNAAQIQSIEQELTRLDSLQSQLNQLESTTMRLRELEGMTRGDLDSLMAEFREAREELETMGLGTMAEDMATVRAHSRRTLQNYLARLKAGSDALDQEILELETMMRDLDSQSGSLVPDDSEPLEDLGSSGSAGGS